MWKRKAQVIRPSAAALALSADNDSDLADASSTELTSQKRRKRAADVIEEGESSRKKEIPPPVGKSTSNDALTKTIDDASSLAESGDYESALDLFERTLADNPDEARVHEMKAQVLMELERDYVAVRAAEQAVRCAPIWFTAHRTLARAQLNVNDLESGTRSFARAAHLSPWDSDLRSELRSAGKLRHHRVFANDGNAPTAGGRPLL
uniref:Tetratricopeptide repeat protein 33 n=1 Tax=Plectus sambesii TaxID=2011161 RepID=A0A914WSW3_9BILA